MRLIKKLITEEQRKELESRSTNELARLVRERKTREGRTNISHVRSLATAYTAKQALRKDTYDVITDELETIKGAAKKLNVDSRNITNWISALQAIGVIKKKEPKVSAEKILDIINSEPTPKSISGV